MVIYIYGVGYLTNVFRAMFCCFALNIFHITEHCFALRPLPQLQLQLLHCRRTYFSLVCFCLFVFFFFGCIFIFIFIFYFLNCCRVVGFLAAAGRLFLKFIFLFSHVHMYVIMLLVS